jgi:adenosine 3'-phospho 5'-phosphosulfate transporter B2
MLMLMHLACDGFASTFQDKLFHQFGMSFYVMTLNVSAVSCLLSLTGLVLQQQLVSSFAFVAAHPEVLPDILLLAVTVRCSPRLPLATAPIFHHADAKRPLRHSLRRW